MESESGTLKTCGNKETDLSSKQQAMSGLSGPDKSISGTGRSIVIGTV